MAREYPRFLFSNPVNTKSKGPFLIHTLEPRIIFRITKNVSDISADDEAWRKFNLYLVLAEHYTIYKTVTQEQLHTIAYHGLDWLDAQIAKGFIQL